MAELNIGRIPISKGEWQEGEVYNKLWQVTDRGSSFQSRIDNNTTRPTALDKDGCVIKANTELWLCIADATNAVNAYTNLSQYNSEDLKRENRVLSFANRENVDGMGYVILRKDNNKVLSQNAISKENTIFEIRYDFDLNGQTINLPKNSILKFEGGSLKNGTIVGNNSSFTALASNKVLFSNIIFSGSFYNVRVDVSTIYNDDDMTTLTNLGVLGGRQNIDKDLEIDLTNKKTWRSKPNTYIYSSNGSTIYYKEHTDNDFNNSRYGLIGLGAGSVIDGITFEDKSKDKKIYADHDALIGIQADNITIKNCKFIDMQSVSIKMLGFRKNCYILNNYFGNGDCGFISQGLVTEDIPNLNLHIENNTFEKTSPYSHSEPISIYNTTIKENAGKVTISNIWIIGNKLIANGATVEAGSIYLGVENDPSPRYSNVFIENNYIEGTYGITSHYLDNSVIAFNVLKGNDRDGKGESPCRISLTSSCNSNKIVFNNISSYRAQNTYIVGDNNVFAFNKLNIVRAGDDVTNLVDVRGLNNLIFANSIYSKDGAFPIILANGINEIVQYGRPYSSYYQPYLGAIYNHKEPGRLEQWFDDKDILNVVTPLYHRVDKDYSKDDNGFPIISQYKWEVFMKDNIPYYSSDCNIPYFIIIFSRDLTNDEYKEVSVLYNKIKIWQYGIYYASRYYRYNKYSNRLEIFNSCYNDTTSKDKFTVDGLPTDVTYTVERVMPTITWKNIYGETYNSNSLPYTSTLHSNSITFGDRQTRFKVKKTNQIFYIRGAGDGGSVLDVTLIGNKVYYNSPNQNYRAIVEKDGYIEFYIGQADSMLVTVTSSTRLYKDTALKIATDDTTAATNVSIYDQTGNLISNKKCGVTTVRPKLGTDNTGYRYFDTTLNKPIYWTGSKWVDAIGADV